MVASSITSDTHSEHSDGHTYASSTLGTTASLSSRIASLAVDGHLRGSDADGLSSVGGTSEGVPASYDYEYCSDECDDYVIPEEGEEEEEEEEEEVVELTEEQLIQMLDGAEDPFRVCRRLFLSGNPPESLLSNLKHIPEDHAKFFMANGFLVVDNFLPQGTAAQLRQAGLSMSTAGELRAAAEVDAGAYYTDRSARSDLLSFVHPGQCGNAVEEALQKLQELQDDLRQIMRLDKHQSEYQLAHYQPYGSFYKRHRDALPSENSTENQRKVTAIVYTNPDWQETDGGALRLWPPNRRTARAAGIGSSQPGRIRILDLRSGEAEPPSNGNGNGVTAGQSTALDGLGNGSGTGSRLSNGHGNGCVPGTGAQAADVLSALPHVRQRGDDDEAIVDVAPVSGRLLVFLSGCIDHEVLPSFADRVALTAWCQ